MSRHCSWSRRAFVQSATALGAASLSGLPSVAAAEPPPETTRIRLIRSPAICLAPSYLAEELLRLEGFSNIEYFKLASASTAKVLAAGRADLAMVAVQETIPVIDQGAPAVLLAGIHAGCYELFGNERVGAIRELRGNRVAISAMGEADHVFIASMLAYVGMDPRKDIQWITTGSIPDSMRYFLERKADAFLGFPPQPQLMRARKAGRVIVDTRSDRPWSQYFCCMVAGNTEFVRHHSIATKRALRAILRASDICVQEPERAAKFLVDKGYEGNYGLALEVLKSLPYDRWRQADPDDTVRFLTLRLREVGMVKSTPQRIIAQGTDWRFLNELKKELKA